MRKSKARVPNKASNQAKHLPDDQAQYAASSSTLPRTDTASSEERIVVPLVEETLQVDKEWVQAGALRLRKSVQKYTERVPIALQQEQLEVEHVPVNRVLAYGEETAPRQEGDVLVIPIVEEELVVTKRQVIREEVRIRKRVVVDQQEVSDTLRKEHLEINHTGEIEVIDQGTSGS